MATMEPLLVQSNNCHQCLLGLVMLLGPVMVMESLWQLLELERQECLGIIPVKVQGKSNNQITETYALLYNG